MSESDPWRRARERAKILPGEARRAELELIIRELTALAGFIEADYSDDGPGCDVVASDAALLLRRAADKLICLRGSDYDFRAELTKAQP